MAGLNGDPVFTARDVPVGRVSGEPYGYKRNLTVTVSVRMERLTRQAEYETVEHSKVAQPLDFSITTAVWRPDRQDSVSGGATVAPLREITGYVNGFTADTVAKLLELAPWHLNAMTAGCAHQAVVMEKDQYGHKRPSLTLTEPCPITGYKYGHAWLVRELPAGFLDSVRAVFAQAEDQAHIWSAQPA